MRRTRAASRCHVPARPRRRRRRSGRGERQGLLGRRQRPRRRWAQAAHRAHRRSACSTSERASRGLRKLRADGKLRRAADGHAGDMVAKRYFDHDVQVGRLVRHPHQAHGLDAARAAPGPSARTSATAPARSRRRARWSSGWMNSAGHRANILARQFQPDRHRRRQRRPDGRLAARPTPPISAARSPRAAAPRR